MDHEGKQMPSEGWLIPFGGRWYDITRAYILHWVALGWGFSFLVTTQYLYTFCIGGLLVVILTLQFLTSLLPFSWIYLRRDARFFFGFWVKSVGGHNSKKGVYGSVVSCEYVVWISGGSVRVES